MHFASVTSHNKSFWLALLRERLSALQFNSQNHSSSTRVIESPALLTLIPEAFPLLALPPSCTTPRLSDTANLLSYCLLPFIASQVLLRSVFQLRSQLQAGKVANCFMTWQFLYYNLATKVASANHFYIYPTIFLRISLTTNAPIRHLQKRPGSPARAVSLPTLHI